MRSLRRLVVGGVCALVCLAAASLAPANELVLADFDDVAPGSVNPRDGWFAFGAGTTDRGVRADGAAGAGAYHAVDWSQATWGVGDVATAAVDLSAFDALTVDARFIWFSGGGSAALELALDMPDGSEYATPAQPISSGYATLTFEFDDLVQTAGSGPLDLATGKPKLILRKGSQTGTGRFDFDEITAWSDPGGAYELTPVVLYPPWDGDAVRAMWLYASAGDLIVDSAAASQQVLDLCAREGINRIYFGAYRVWALGTAEERENLRTFLAAASASGIQVDALLDGIDWHQSPTLVRNRIDQVLAINDATPADSSDDFAAIHFDIEFWLSSDWGGSVAQREQVARDYLQNVLVTARSWMDANGGAHLATGVDLSTHFDTAGMLPDAFEFAGQNKYFLQHVFDHTDEVVLMSYYDSVNALATTTLYELDMAAAYGRTLQLGADLQPGEPPINTFADNLPTPYAAMTRVLQDFHANLSPARLAALDGFSVFHYGGYLASAPPVRVVGDLDGDEDVDPDDLELFIGYFGGPGAVAAGLPRDADFDQNAAVDLADYAQLSRAATGLLVEARSPAGVVD